MTKTDPFEPGQRLVVVQQIPQRSRVWTTRTIGRVLRFEQKKTGSWFAHAKGDRLWLDRLVMQKDDGEIVDFVLDEYTHVELIPQKEPAEPAVEPADAAGGGEAEGEAAGEADEAKTASE